MYNDAKDIVKQSGLIALLLTSVNPIGLAIGIFGLAAYAGYRASSGRNAAKETVAKPLPNRPQTIGSTVGKGYSSHSTAVDSVNGEALKREMIRQAMSELGKRSAAARVRRKELMLEEFNDEIDSD